LAAAAMKPYAVCTAATYYYYYYYYYFNTTGSKDPEVKKTKRLKSKCRMARGPAGELAECRAKAQS